MNNVGFLYTIMCIHTAYATGSLEGSPAFLGNFPDVGLIFLIYTKERSISVPGSWNFFTSSIVPPRTLTAFLAFTNSSSISPDLYATKYPPTFTNGRLYSTRVAKLATARETLTSKCSLKSLFLPPSSALE